MSKGTKVRSVRISNDLYWRIIEAGRDRYGTEDFSKIVRYELTNFANWRSTQAEATEEN